MVRHNACTTTVFAVFHQCLIRCCFHFGGPSLHLRGMKWVSIHSFFIASTSLDVAAERNVLCTSTDLRETMAEGVVLAMLLAGTSYWNHKANDVVDLRT